MYFEWKDLTINRSLAYACRTWGSRTALVCGDQRFTYNQFQREVFEMAHGLKELGVQKGTRVAYLMTGGPEWACLFYALVNLGAIVVPLNLTWVGREIEQGLKLTDSEVLILTDEMRGKDFATILQNQFSELQTARPGDLKIERLPLLQKIVILSASGRKFDYAYDFHEVKKSGSNFNAQEMLALGEQIAPDDVSSYMLTSGSTGFPKPVIHTHNTMLFAVANMADCHEISSDDRFLHIAPTYHVAGLDVLMMPHLRGAAVHIAGIFEPEQAMRIIEKDRITMMWGFDVHYLMMRRHPRYGLYDISSLEKAMVGNSPGSYDEIRTMGIPHQGCIYGASENGGAHAHLPYRYRFDEQRKKFSNGLPLSFNETKIIDHETGKVLGVNEPGEICTRGPGTFKGYYKMPEETAAALDAEGFFHSGDYGWLDDKGFIYYRGRLKDTVKTGGENVSSREVEITLETGTPYVGTAIVFGVPDAQWGEAVTAMVELKPGQGVSEEELKKMCKDLMAGYKIPKRFIFVKPSEWLVTPTGKFDKKALRSKAMQMLGIKDTA